jgi:prepilin-type N-terminal cleavage/methylation domain-containing protein
MMNISVGQSRPGKFAMARCNDMTREIKLSVISRSSSKQAFTLVELLVVLAVITVGLAVLVPFIQQHIESDRRSRCLNNAHQIGLAIQNYASTYNNALPPSARTYNKSPTEKSVGGYSFLVVISPFMDCITLKSRGLPTTIPGGDIDAAMSGNKAFSDAMNESWLKITCPANTNAKYQNPAASPPQFALTNYKAMGATTRDSLLMASNPAGKPPYGTAAMHPDGAMFPSDKNLPMSALADGTSNTILVMETIDDTNSRWMVGSECTLVGLPQESSPTGEKPKAPYVYFTPPGYSETRTGKRDWTWHCDVRTFLSYDFGPSGADAGKYEDPGWAKGPPAYGPSSMHPGVVITGMCDGSVIALSKQCNAAYLFFLVTKNNNDPLDGP